jgi:gas vesicle protein
LFENIIKNSERGTKLQKFINSFGSVFGSFQELLGDYIPNFQAKMIKHNKNQKNDITYCRGLIDKAQLEADRKSQEFVNMFISLQKHKMRDLEKQEDRTLQLDIYENDLYLAINKLENDLMDTEYRLGDALRESIDKFFSTIKDTIDLIKKDISDLIEELKDKQEIFHEDLKTAALDQQREFAQEIDAQYPDGDIPEL